MDRDFSALNAFFDKIFILTLPRLKDRIDNFTRELQGLNYEIFYGVDKEEISMESMKQKGIYDSAAYTSIYKKQADMNPGMLCCSLGHVKIYESIIANKYNRVLILEDDVFPLSENLPLFPQLTAELPEDWEVFYLGYEGNEIFGWKQTVKRLYYLTFPFHTSLRLSRAIFSNYYPRPLSKYIARAGFHDCTHAYGVTLEGAKKLLQQQTPVVYNADNLLSYAIALEKIKGYISMPKLFNQRTARYEIRSLTSS
jgi:glycosyl transferase, family 25